MWLAKQMPLEYRRQPIEALESDWVNGKLSSNAAMADLDVDASHCCFGIWWGCENARPVLIVQQMLGEVDPYSIIQGTQRRRSREMWSWETSRVKPTGRGEEMQLGLDGTGRRTLQGRCTRSAFWTVNLLTGSTGNTFPQRSLLFCSSVLAFSLHSRPVSTAGNVYKHVVPL